jgi:hypothetical protein
LRASAAALDVDEKRLVFAGRMANAAHLARYRLADLFLDTAPYGAHTTASDALWMGVPVLTCPGNSFAARVCGSLVRAAGIPGMICTDWDEYRTKAIALATDGSQLAAIRQKLRVARDECVLFDTPRLVRSLEYLFEAMWADYRAGRQPVPVLNHLPVYHRIGCEAGRPTLPAREALLSWYRLRLGYENAVQGLPADGLLWELPSQVGSL